MIHKIFNINDINKDILSEYFPLLTQQKKDKILSMNDGFTASQTLVCDMLSRQCLSELCGAPESSFQLLINPNGKSVVTNFNAKISVCSCGEYVGCAVSENNVGMSMLKTDAFGFAELQKNLSDSEIRYLLSDLSYSVTDIIRNKHLENKEILTRYATVLTLKKALLYASGKVIMNNNSKITFNFSHNRINSDNPEYNVSCCKYISDYNLVYSVVERSIK